MKLIFLILIFTININALEYIKLGNDIYINICSQYPVSESYLWEFTKKPEDSHLNYESITSENIKNCFINFKPDTEGLYIINLKVDKENIFFEYQILKSMEKLSIDISFLINYKYYENKIDYYKDYENNNLIFNIDDYLANPSSKSNNYKQVESPLNINIKSFEDKNIIGVTTVYYKDNKQISRFTTKNISSEDAELILFSPLKSINNYPSILYSGNINEVINLKYDSISFYNFNIENNEEISELTLEIKSLSLDKCLIDNLNSVCKYERTINTNKKISLPKGEYKIKIHRKDYKEITKIVTINDNYTMIIDNFEKENIAKVTLPDIVKSVSFSNNQNQNYFFNLSESKTVDIPYGVYSITLLAYEGAYNIKSIEIKTDLKIKYKWSKINISIKEDNKTIYGGVIIINNQNFIYNNGKVHDFYIGKD